MVVRLLICDPAAFTRAAMSRLLDDADGLNVVGAAANLAEAIEAVGRLRPDVVLLALTAETGDPAAVVAELAAGLGRYAARLLVLSDRAPYALVVSVFRSGGRGFLLNQDSPDDVVYGVRKVAEGGGVLAPSIVSTVVGQLDPVPLPSRFAGGPAAALTEREREVLRLIAAGMSNAEIAAELRVREATVKSHVSRMLTKLGLRDRMQAAVFARDLGVLAPAPRLEMHAVMDPPDDGRRPAV